MDGRGPAQVRAGDPGDGPIRHDGPAGGDHRPDRPALEGRAIADLADPDHARAICGAVQAKAAERPMALVVGNGRHLSCDR